VSRAGEEPRKVLGIARREMGSRSSQDDEQRRVLGFPVDWYGPVDEIRLPSLRHPIKAYKRWALIRRLGPYAPDEDDPPRRA
jgi:hypothetical protein